MMPGETGMELTRSLRQTMQVPILMLTARSEIESRIQGLEFGADDYLAKPFEPRELLLRINNILKRGQPATTPLIEQVRFGPFTFNRERLELSRGGELVHLTDRERQIMAIFAAAPGETVRARRSRRRRRPGRRAHRRRADQPAAAQDRSRPGQSALPADRARHRLPAGDLGLTAARG